MTPFLQCSDIGRAVIVSLGFAVFSGLLFLLILQGIRLHRSCNCLIPGLLLLFCSFDLLCLLEGHNNLNPADSMTTLAGQWLGSLPWVIHVFLMLASGFYCFFAIWREKQSAEKEITPDSIRMALDNLPSGLCFSDTKGIPLLTNRKMYQLAQEAMGQPFRNAEELWQKLAELEKQNGIERLESEGFLTFRWPNSNIWQFSRAKLMLREQQYIQTTATNITRHYTLTQELLESNAAMDKQYRRLNTILKKIVQTAREEEILASKVKIHNELGQCLLTARRYLAGSQSEKNISQLFSQWQDVIRFMEITLKEAEHPSDNAMRELLEAAEALNCTIIFEGGTPEEAGRYTLLKNAIREAMTNAIRHAGADELSVRMEIQEDILYAVLKDNANMQIASISEGGGLSSLRRRIEQTGGTMEIRYNNGVELHIKIQAGRTHDDKGIACRRSTDCTRVYGDCDQQIRNILH